MNTLIALTDGAPAAGVILATVLVVGLLGLMVAPSMVERGMLRPYWLLPRREFSTVISSAFLHADLAHLLFNAISFWAFGFGLERRIGSERFVALYGLGLLASAAGTWLKHRHDPEYRTLGASGAILAVLFASIIYFPTQSIFILPFPVPIPAPLFAIGYLLYTVLAARSHRARINHDAHLSGALVGIFFTAVSDPDALRRAVHSMLG